MEQLRRVVLRPRIHSKKCRGTKEDVKIMRYKIEALCDVAPLQTLFESFKKTTKIYKIDLLRPAIKENHIRCVKFALNAGYYPRNRSSKKVSQERMSLLKLAVGRCRSDVVKLLLQHGFRTNEVLNGSYSLLGLAYLRNEVETFALILKNKFKCSKRQLVLPLLPVYKLKLFYACLKENKYEFLLLLLLHSNTVGFRFSLIHPEYNRPTMYYDFLGNFPLLSSPYKDNSPLCFSNSLSVLREVGVLSREEERRSISNRLQGRLLQPLSLLKMSRIAIKNSMGRRNYLIHVERLKVPNKIKDFLAYADIIPRYLTK